MNTLVNDFVSPRILYCGLGFVITGLSGILLSHSGRPLNSMIFAVHKLVAVATIILTVVSVRDLYKSAAIQAPQPALIGIMALVFVALLASGALLIAADPSASEKIIKELAVEGIVASVIGRVQPAEFGRNLVGKEGTTPLPAFSRDEITRLFA